MCALDLTMCVYECLLSSRNTAGFLWKVLIESFHLSDFIGQDLEVFFV